MSLKNNFIIFVLFNIFNNSLCFQNNDRFTSAEIAIPFKTINERDNIVIKTNILGENKNCSIDITSSQQLLYLTKETLKENNILNKNEISLINQDGEKINGYRKNTNIEFLGNEYRKGVIIGNITSIMIKSNKKDKMHSFGFSHFIEEDNSLVHILYNAHLIKERQFSILYSYPNWGTLSFGQEGTLITDMKNLQRECKAVNSKYWGCHLSGIYIENVELPLEDDKIKKNNINIEINHDTIFDNGASDIVVPEEVFDFFYNYYFEKSLFIEEKCRIYENYFLKKIICDKLEKNKNKNDFEKMKRIHFVFDDVVDIYLLGKYFFDQNKNFKIIYIKENENFIMGKVFLSHYNMIYNYDEDKIIFFGMFGGRYLQSKINYSKKIEFKLLTNNEYIRYKIPKINENIFPLLKLLFAFILIGNIITFLTLCKINEKKKEREFLLE